MGAAGNITGNLGLYSKSQPYRARDRRGRFCVIRQTPEQRLIIKTTADMRKQLGLPPLEILQGKSNAS
ncbi:MAG: hypothetical protein ABJP02_05010 [Parasphingorhabdus sp.]|uniref:hypothetical protein n=1 Tax=Parasphingorhabdus sp. TaxID=2709688 RepID=UPI00329A3E9F